MQRCWLSMVSSYWTANNIFINTSQRTKYLYVFMAQIFTEHKRMPQLSILHPRLILETEFYLATPAISSCGQSVTLSIINPFFLVTIQWYNTMSPTEIISKLMDLPNKETSLIQTQFYHTLCNNHPFIM